MTLLRAIGLVTDQIGHDLQTATELFTQLQRQVQQLLQHPIQSNANRETGIPRFQMNITGPRIDGILDHHVNKLGNFRLSWVRKTVQVLGGSIHKVLWD